MDRLIGIFLIVVAAASFATSPIFARIAYDAGANPNTFLFIRFAIAATVITLIMVFKGLRWPCGRLLVSLVLIGGVCFAGLNLSFYTALTLAPVNLVLPGWTAIILCALFSTVFGIVCLYEGLKRVDSANTAIVSTFEVVVAAVLAILILGETMSMSKIIGACMIIIAVTILGRGEYKTARVRIQ